MFPVKKRPSIDFWFSRSFKQRKSTKKIGTFVFETPVLGRLSNLYVVDSGKTMVCVGSDTLRSYLGSGKYAAGGNWRQKGLNFEIFVSGDDLAEGSDVKKSGFKRPCKPVKFRYFKRFFFLNIKHGFPWIGVAVGVTYEGYVGWWMVFTWEILVSSDMCFAVPLMPVRPGDTYLPTAWFISRCPGVGLGLKLLPCVLDSCQSFTVFFLLLFWRKVEVMASNFGSQVVVQVGVIISKTRLKGKLSGVDLK